MDTQKTYWNNWLQKEEVQEPKINDYILQITFINQHNSSVGINEWLCFEDINKIIGFMKYIILPSVQISRANMQIKNIEELTIDTFSFFDALDVLEEMIGSVEITDEYENWMNSLNDISNQHDFEKLATLLKDIANSVDSKDGIILTLNLHKNIKSVGFNLLKEYEEDNMLDELEESFNFSKEEIEYIFNNVDKNIFLLKRIIPILNNLNMVY